MEQINHELAEAIVRSETSEKAEVRQRQLSEKLRYASEMRLCQESFRKGDISGYQELLENHIPADGQPDHRGFSWYWLWDQGHAKPLTIDRYSGAAYWVEFSPDETWLAACGDDGTVKIWDWQRGALLTSIKSHANIADAARFIRDDKKLITCGNEPTIRIWDLANPKVPAGELMGHRIGVDSIRISADEKLMVSAGADGATVVWDLDTRQPIATKVSLRKQRVSDVALFSGGDTIPS